MTWYYNHRLTDRIFEKARERLKAKQGETLNMEEIEKVFDGPVNSSLRSKREYRKAFKRARDKGLLVPFDFRERVYYVPRETTGEEKRHQNEIEGSIEKGYIRSMEHAKFSVTGFMCGRKLKLQNVRVCQRKDLSDPRADGIEKKIQGIVIDRTDNQVVIFVPMSSLVCCGYTTAKPQSTKDDSWTSMRLPDWCNKQETPDLWHRYYKKTLERIQQFTI